MERRAVRAKMRAWPRPGDKVYFVFHPVTGDERRAHRVVYWVTFSRQAYSSQRWWVMNRGREVTLMNSWGRRTAEEAAAGTDWADWILKEY